MSLIKDIKLFIDFKRVEQKLLYQEDRGRLPFIHMFGYEKAFGKPEPHDSKSFVERAESWAYVCASKNAFSVAAWDLQLFKRIKKEKNKLDLEPVTDHIFLELMNNVNPFMNKTELKFITDMGIEITGNAYWYIPRNGLNVPAEIWPIPSQWMKIVPSKKDFIAGYVMQVPGDPAKVPFDVDEIIHFRWPSIFDMHYGTPPMYGAIHNIDLNKQMKEYGISFMKNSAQPSGILTTEDSLSEDQWKQLHTMWNFKYKGTKNAGKIAILMKGLTYQKIGTTLGEMAYPELSRGIRDEILAAFGTPASKLGLVEDVNRANADANDYTYQKETIKPRLMLIQEKLNEKLMPIYDLALVCKFEDNVPLDREFRLREQQTHIQAGYSSIDEEREKDGLEALDLPETEVPLIPFSLMPAGTPKPEPVAPGDTSTDTGKSKDEEKKKSIDIKARREQKWELFVSVTGPQERLFTRALVRYFKKQRDKVMANVDKLKSMPSMTKAGWASFILFNLKEENLRLADLSTPYIFEMYKSGMEMGYRELGASFEPGILLPKVSRQAKIRVDYFSEKVNTNVAKLLSSEIDTGLANGESVAQIGKRVETVYDKYESWGAKRVAQTETVGATNEALITSYKELGVEKKVWITAKDERVRNSHHIDGQVVGITDGFTLRSGTRLQYPGDRTSDAPASDIINCRCSCDPVK